MSTQEADASTTEAVPEPVTPEVVDVPSTEIERAGGAAVEAAADAALAFPGVPGRDEFLALAMQARMLSLSGAAPEAVRDNPYVAFHVSMVGRDLGISPSAALELIDVITTKHGPRLSLSPQLLNGQIRRLGLGEILKKSESYEGVVAVAVGPRGIDRRCRLTWRQDVHADDCDCDILGESVFTWEDAQVAGLVSKACEATQHKQNCSCGFGWKNYPKRLMWWRASGFAADDYFPEAGLGLYSPEELGAVVDVEGRPIDPASVELPDGYTAPKTGSGVAGDETGELADPDALWLIQERARALPNDQRAALNERWTNLPRLKSFAPWRLPASRLALVESLLKGCEGQAKALGEWDPETANVELRLQWTSTAAALLCGSLGLGMPPESAQSPDEADSEPTGATESDENESSATTQPSDTPAEQSEQQDAPAETSEPAESLDDDTKTVERIIGEVKAMPFAEVTKALSDREIDVAGKGPKVQRRTLAELRVRDELGDRADS